MEIFKCIILIILQSHGVVTGGYNDQFNWCVDYSFKPCDHYNNSASILADCEKPTFTPKCHMYCQEYYQNEYYNDLHYFQYPYSIRPSAIESEIYLKGPVSTSLYIYSDFTLYSSGIYSHQYGNYLGLLIVKIVGWGEENGIKYWKVANSWNKYWGEDGFIRILKGVDMCSIESKVVVSLPYL